MGGLEGLSKEGVFRSFIMSMRREEAMTQVRQCLVAMGSPFVDLSTLCRTGTSIAGSYQPFQVPSALSNQALLHFRARPHRNISNTVQEDPLKLSIIIELYCVYVCLKQNSTRLSSSSNLPKTNTHLLAGKVSRGISSLSTTINTLMYILRQILSPKRILAMT